MPATEFGRAIANIVKREIFSVLQTLRTKIQELETKVEVQRLEIETLKDRLTKNESMLPKKQD